VGQRRHDGRREPPRTVLFRVVLHARAALLNWRPSAGDYARMDRPVQLCRACYAIYAQHEAARLAAAARAQADAATAEAAAAAVERRRRPPGWKPAVQRRFERDLVTDRGRLQQLL
ncbi:unnamed protein product, partial [Phaeothamnion confervicola]